MPSEEAEPADATFLSRLEGPAGQAEYFIAERAFGEKLIEQDLSDR